MELGIKIGTSENKPLRDEFGRLLPGHTANPNGRPPGSVSLLGILKAKLEECPENFDKKTYAQLIIERMLSNAIKEGNDQMIKLIWAYIEGMPKQSLEHTGIPGTQVNVYPNKTIVFTGINEIDGKSNLQDIHATESEGCPRIGQEVSGS